MVRARNQETQWTRTPHRGAGMPDELTERPTGSYLSGGWVALAGSRVWVLVDAEPGEDFVVELWRKLRHAWDLTAVAELLEGRGRKNRPSFGLVAQSEACVVVALGGRAVAELTIRDSVERVECPGFVTSIEYRFASSPTSVRVFSQADAPPGARLPLSGGVVRAAEIVLEWEVTPDGERLAAPSSIQRMDDSKPPVPESAVGAEHLATEVAGAAATLPAVSLPQFRSGGLDDGTVHAATEADVPLPGEFAGREGTYDHLFGHTVQRTVEGAAVRSSDAEAP